MMENINIIYKYSRNEALADRVLIDVSHVAKDYGITLNTVLTISVFMDATKNMDETVRASEANVHAIFRALKAASESLPAKADTVYFNVALDGGTCLDLWAQCHPGDGGEPVITVMRTDED